MSRSCNKGRDKIVQFEEKLLSKSECDNLLSLWETKNECKDNYGADFKADCYKASTYFKVKNGKVESHRSGEFSVINQSKGYNDFQGGLVRKYRQIPEEIMTSEAFTNVVNKFISVGDNLMEGKLMLAFLISYKLSSEDVEQNALKGDLIGQGIHTDGMETGAITCLERDDEIDGVVNSFYHTLDEKSICFEQKLLAGDFVWWSDNKCYHSVTNYVPKNALKQTNHTNRTIILIMGPADHCLKGEMISSNKLLRTVMPVEKKLAEKETSVF